MLPFVPAPGNVCVYAAVVELAARPRWLQGRELHMLPLKTHLESVLAVDLGEVIGQLERGTDFVGRQEGVAAQG